LQLFFLGRLSWLLQQRREYSQVLAKDDWRLRLLNKALYSTFCDCLNVGLQSEARRLLERERALYQEREQEQTA